MHGWVLNTRIYGFSLSTGFRKVMEDQRSLEGEQSLSSKKNVSFGLHVMRRSSPPLLHHWALIFPHFPYKLHSLTKCTWSRWTNFHLISRAAWMKIMPMAQNLVSRGHAIVEHIWSSSQVALHAQQSTRFRAMEQHPVLFDQVSAVSDNPIKLLVSLQLGYPIPSPDSSNLFEAKCHHKGSR